MDQASLPPAVLKVRVQPRASHNQVLGYDGETLRVRVTAPPEDGKANDAVVHLLAEALGVAPGRVRILRGQAVRNKLVAVESLTLDEVLRRLKGD